MDGPNDERTKRQVGGAGDQPNREFLVGAARAVAGALIFALPMLMTMEMWWLGFHMDRFRIALLLIVTFPLLVALSHYIGFEPTFDWREDVIDALVAFAMAFLTCALLLGLFGVISPEMTLVEIVGKISIQTVPAAIGALLAFSQLGVRSEADTGEEGNRYPRELFFMLLGALFLSLNLAPTEEMVLIGYLMTPLHTLGLILLSLAVIQGFGIALARSRKSLLPQRSSHAAVFTRFTVAGYAIAVLASVASMWLFGQLDGATLDHLSAAATVLAFPASVGASAARVLL